jgi:AsmA protein
MAEMAAAKSRGTRRLALIVLAVVAVIGAIAIAVPFLISSDAVKKSISDQITHWTGRTFTFTGDAKLRLFPYLTVRLQDARLANPVGTGDEPFIVAEVMTGKVEILPLLRGRLKFAEFRLGNPTINLEVDSAGNPNWILDQGVVGTLASKGDSELPGDDPSPPTPRAEVTLGRFLVRGGTVNFGDARNGTREVLSDVDVDFNWRSTVDAARGNGTFAWRGEPVAFRGEIGAPLTLLAGGDSPLRVALEAAPANLSFEGMARQFDGMQVEGEASLAVPSVVRFGAWTGALGETSLIRAASIAGKVSWAAALLNLSEMTIHLDGNAGEGALTATVVDGKPRLQGTLDFTRFDLTPQLDALRAAVDADGAWRSDPIGLPLVTGADVDLRLSAGQAVARGAEVGPVAASLLVKDGIIRIEVGEAHLGEGIVEASLLAEMKDGVLSGAASLKADGVPAEAAADILGIPGVTGTAEASLDLKASGATWGDLAADVSGNGSVSVIDGSVDGVDLTLLPQMIADPASSAGGGATSFGLAAATLALAEGTLSTGDLRVEGPGYALSLAGKAALPGTAIEARGVLTLGDAREVPFLLNGAWGALQLHPDLGGTLPRDDGGRADSPLPTDG